jgi:4-hydroxy-2-oxoheptanedioate aldolase
MNINENQLKIKLKNNEVVFGIWAIIPNPIVVEILGSSGFDFLILDMEHGVYDQTSLDACIRSCESVGCSPLVRVPGINNAAIQGALDLGSHGIIIPQVTDVQSAKIAVQMTKFSPRGSRGYNPFTRFTKYAGTNNNSLGKLSNNFGLTSIIVETEAALDDLDNILAIDDLDMIYVGIYDLSIALGFNGDIDHPSIIKIVENTVRKIRSAGKAAGMMVKNSQDVKNAINLGSNFLVYSVDSFMLLDAATNAVNIFKQSIKGL